MHVCVCMRACVRAHVCVSLPHDLKLSMLLAGLHTLNASLCANVHCVEAQILRIWLCIGAASIKKTETELSFIHLIVFCFFHSFSPVLPLQHPDGGDQA